MTSWWEQSQKYITSSASNVLRASDNWNLATSLHFARVAHFTVKMIMTKLSGWRQKKNRHVNYLSSITIKTWNRLRSKACAILKNEHFPVTLDRFRVNKFKFLFALNGNLDDIFPTQILTVSAIHTNPLVMKSHRIQSTESPPAWEQFLTKSNSACFERVINLIHGQMR